MPLMNLPLLSKILLAVAVVLFLVAALGSGPLVIAENELALVPLGLASLAAGLLVEKLSV